jgi:hypothetical protein
MARLSIKTDLSDLYEYDPETEKLMFFPDDYVFSVGKSSENICLEAPLSITGIEGETKGKRDLLKRTLAKNYDSSENTSLKFDFSKNDWFVTIEGWSGYIDFLNTDLSGITAVEIVAAAPNAEVTASVKLKSKSDGEYKECGKCEVKPAISHTDFSLYNIPVEIPEDADFDLTNLRIDLGGMMNIWSIQVIKG